MSGPARQGSPAPGEQARQWVVRLASGDISRGEMDALQAWLSEDPQHRVAFERERQVWQHLKHSGEWAREANPAAGARRRRWPVAVAMAAILVLAFCWPRAWLALRADIHAGAVPVARILEDGTEVSLDADSAIALDYAAGRRRVELLRGRAWFRVANAQASPRFQVEALGGTTTDIGTVFEVALAEDEAIAAVAEGQVEVAAVAGRSSPIRLDGGQQARYRQGGPLSRVTAVAPTAIAPWRRGEIVMVDMPLRRAIAELARYRQGPVWVVGRLGDTQRVNALFRTAQADQALDALATRYGLAVHRLPGGVALVIPAR